MKRSGFIILILLISVLSSAAEMEFTKSFDYPQIQQNGEYLSVVYGDCISLGDEGEPLLPWCGIDLLINQNEKLVSVNIIDIKYYPEIETGIMQPASRLFPISKKAPDNYQVVPDQKIYQLDGKYPSQNLGEYSTGYLCGHSIANLIYCPVEYNPAKSTLRFVKSIVISLETARVEDAELLEANLRGSDKVISRLNRIVENPSFVSNYHYMRERIIDYDLLIITSSSLAASFQSYLDYKTSTGYSVTLETTESIYSSYTGVDNAEKVRNCIIDYYQIYGIDYVILGGDAGNPNETAIVPHRGFAVDDEPSLPSDMYFSNLDGNWNDDGDNYWGEQNEIDPYSELSIGRMTVDSALEVANYTNKHILYQNAPVEDDIQKAVMVGEELNNSPWTYGGTYKDQIVSGGYFDGYSTAGIAGNFNVNYFYDRDGNWNKYDLFNEFSTTGINLLNHLGHSSPTYNMKMENSDLTAANFTNNGITRGFVIGYSQGCYNGSFDNYHYNGYYTEDCFAEVITGTIAGGEVACIANSRYGWYMPGGTNSSSQYYDRMFFHGTFGEDIFKIGDVNSFSHEDNVSYMQTNSNMRWVCYQTNLFGDPSLDIWTDLPEELNVIIPASVSIGVSQINIQTDVAEARVAVLQNGELLGRGITDFNGMINLELENPVSNPAPLAVSIIAHNYNRYESMIIVVSDQPYVVYQGHTLDDTAGNGDGLPDYGETISLDLQLNNVGNFDAENTSLTLSTQDEYITFIDAEEEIGTITAETIIDLPAAVCFMISDAIPDQHQVNFTLTVSDDDQFEWVSYFQINVNAPDLIYGGISVDDSYNGDNDGILDPGEIAEVTIEILNIGQSDSPFASLQFISANPELVIENPVCNLGLISANGNATGVFTVIVGTDIEFGTPVHLTLICNADNYSFTEEITESVGLIVEDFETGDFSSFDWEFSGNADWIINTLAYEGSYSAKSGSIGNSQNSILSININVLFNSEISFMYRVSSEAGYDFLRFYIDGVEMGSWSGEIPWAQAGFMVEQGEHNLLWRYEKDVYVSSGSDCAWLDYIIFPAIGIPDPAVMVLDIEELSIILEEGETGYATINISNAGEENLLWSITKNYHDSRDSGGPDGYGYMWMDSNDMGDIEFDWIDISGEGTAVSFPHNDEGTSPLPIGFSFNYYGTDYDEFIINANGWIGFASDNTAWSNSSLPDEDAPRAAIMPFWDDLYPAIGGNGGGTVYYQNFSDHLVVMFHNVIHYPGSYNGTYDFEVIIYETGEIKFQYNSLSGDLDTCTIGLQDADAFHALQIVYDDDYLEEGLAIGIRKVVDWLQISETNGEILMNDEQNLLITAVTDELTAAVYHCDLIFNTNDPLNQTLIIPVTLSIGAGIIYGDVDSSQIVDSYDASCVLQYIVGLDPLPEIDPVPWEIERLEAADVDNNNFIEAFDGSLILQYVVGIIDEFPAQNGDPVNLPDTAIRMDCTNEGDILYFDLIAEEGIYALSLMASGLESVSLGEPEIIDPQDVLFAWNPEGWMFSCCRANAYEDNELIARIPVTMGSDPGLENFLIQINNDNWTELTYDFGAVTTGDNDIIMVNELRGNYPNPFNPQTNIAFSVKEDNTSVEIRIYNIRGQIVEKLTDTIYDAGNHYLIWNADGFASGIYFYTCRIADDYLAKRKMLLIK
jgi:hypothetical protein